MSHQNEIFLSTPRLILRTPREDDIIRFQDFDKRNRAHLSPWRSATQNLSMDYKSEIAKWRQEFEENKAIRFMLFLKDQPDGNLIGVCNFSQIFRGPFQACYLGYHIDSLLEGKGLMSEAVKEAIEYMFEKQKIHRIMANYMPSNQRSARLLNKLGFIIEGQAKDYLMINGRWEDHVLTSLTNLNWLLCK